VPKKCSRQAHSPSAARGGLAYAEDIGKAAQRVDFGRRGPRHALGWLAKAIDPHRAISKMRGGGGVLCIGRLKGHLGGRQAKAIDPQAIDVGMRLEDPNLFDREDSVEGIGEPGAFNRRLEHLR